MSINPKIIIGTVLFNPSERTLSQLDILIGAGFPILLICNSKIHKREWGSKFVEFIQNESNMGIGYGMAQLGMYAYENHYDYFLFLDQDTCISKKYLEYIRNSIILNEEGYSRAGVINFNSNKKGCYETSVVINSGSIFPVMNLKKIGFHSPSIFLDCVDLDYCLNAKIDGFSVLVDSVAPDFDHVKMQDGELSNIFGFQHPMLKIYPLWRIRDTVYQTIRLLLKSGIYLKWDCFVYFFRFFLNYIVCQFLARINKSLRFK